MEAYQDYVIKDGKFIGKFEEMYQKFPDPWYQMEEVENSYSRLNTILSLQKLKAVSVLEAGCGLGAFTNYLSTALPDMKFVGMDISETAIQKARSSYPELQFMIGSLKEIEHFKTVGGNDFDVIILSEIMWYVLQDLDEIIEKLKRCFSEKYLIINQTFYRERQEYGREYFTNLNEMFEYMKMNVIGYTTSYLAENEVSYETHSILKIG